MENQNDKYISVYDSFIESISVIADSYYFEEVPNLRGGYDLHVYNRNLNIQSGSLAISSVILNAAYEFCISEEGSKCDYMIVSCRISNEYIPVLILYIK